jgi:hypothetical protein
VCSQKHPIHVGGSTLEYGEQDYFKSNVESPRKSDVMNYSEWTNPLSEAKPTIII